MDIVLVGGGEVGEAIARSLVDDHDVTIVEADLERADELRYDLDVMVEGGDGTDPAVLEAADIEAAELLLTVTDDDRTNILAAGTAKAITDVFTLTRVEDTKYLETWERSEGAFGVDYMVATDLITARVITQAVGLPNAIDSELFARGLVQMAEFRLDAESPVVDMTVAEADQYESLTFAAIFRDDEVEIPTGETALNNGDRVVVIGSTDSVDAFARDLEPEATPEKHAEVVIVGGSEVGYHVARLLSERGLSPRLIEEHAGRARNLAEALPKTTVFHSDATDLAFLRREHVDTADVLVSVLDSDEKNLLEVLLADRLGVARTIATIDRPAYFDLFEAVGLDVGISPRTVIAEEIKRFTMARNLENVAFIETDKAEVIEVELTPSNRFVGQTLAESREAFPPGMVVGAITRDRQFVVPRGQTQLQAGDHLVVFARSEAADEVEDLLTAA